MFEATRLSAFLTPEKAKTIEKPSIYAILYQINNGGEDNHNKSCEYKRI
jgi:hypothetical protein